MDLKNLQLVAVLAVAALLFASRLVKGAARETPEGLAFPMKPLVIWARFIAILLYAGLFAYPLWISRQSIPPWLLIVLFVAFLYSLFQLPGTIVLTPNGVVQRFWFRGAKAIAYNEVMAMQTSQAGRATRVLGDNRVVITHTFNHVDGTSFVQQLSRRTGKSLTR